MKNYCKTCIMLLVTLGCTCLLFSAYLTNAPVSLKQPNNESLECFASGDEFYSWLHDSEGYTIIQSPTSGYYVYAEKQGDELIAGKLIAGKDNPRLAGLKPKLNISETAYQARRSEFDNGSQTRITPITGTMNNIIIYIRFSDQSEFTRQTAAELTRYNSTDTNAVSIRNYYQEASYGILNVQSHLFPTQVGATIVSYQDIYPRSYFCPYDELSNPNGYSDSNRTEREKGLVTRAVNNINSMLPPGLDLDVNNDGKADNVVIFIHGSVSGSNNILWPHQSTMGSIVLNLGDKTVDRYNFGIESNSSVGVFCHELGHTLGAPDLYHYSTSSTYDPVNRWDLMATDWSPPPQFSAYSKFKYFGWIADIPTITNEQVYNLNPLTSATNKAFRINSPNSSTEYYIVEYRKQEGAFESALPGSGLLIYRVNTLALNGNGYGLDELYVYRPSGTLTVNGDPSMANYNADVQRTVFNDNSNPNCFLSNGLPGGIQIHSIGSAGETISFALGVYKVDWSSNPLYENLEGDCFPPLGWTSQAVFGSEVFNKTNTGTNPNCNSYSFPYMMKYVCRDNQAGNSAIFTSPCLIVAEQSSARYAISFRMNRDSGYASSLDRVEIYRNTSNNLSGSPVLLGTVHRSLSLAPTGSVPGWNQFSYLLSPPTNGNYYIILKAVSGNGNNIYIDDLILERHCQATISNPSPTDNGTSVSLNPVLSWQRSGLAPTGYRISLGTNYPPSSVLDGIVLGNVSNYTASNTLAANTRYFWQVIL